MFSGPVLVLDIPVTDPAAVALILQEDMEDPDFYPAPVLDL